MSDCERLAVGVALVVRVPVGVGVCVAVVVGVTADGVCDALCVADAVTDEVSDCERLAVDVLVVDRVTELVRVEDGVCDGDGVVDGVCVDVGVGARHETGASVPGKPRGARSRLARNSVTASACEVLQCEPWPRTTDDTAIDAFAVPTAPTPTSVQYFR